MPGGLNARYEDNLRESVITDSQQTKSTVLARVPRSSCNDIRLADLLVQSGQRVLNGGMKSFSIQNVAEMKNQSLGTHMEMVN